MARPSLGELFCPNSAALGNRRPFKARSAEWSQEQEFGMISAASKVKEGGYGAASTRDVEAWLQRCTPSRLSSSANRGATIIPRPGFSISCDKGL